MNNKEWTVATTEDGVFVSFLGIEVVAVWFDDDPRVQIISREQIEHMAYVSEDDMSTPSTDWASCGRIWMKTEIQWIKRLRAEEEHTLADWQAAVSAGETTLGYASWRGLKTDEDDGGE